MLPYLVGFCVVVRRPLLSSHTIMQPSTISLPAAFVANHHPPPIPRHCRCRRATTAATATTVVKLTDIYCQRNWQQ
jgi:hypothetical protein